MKSLKLNEQAVPPKALIVDVQLSAALNVPLANEYKVGGEPNKLR